MGSRLSVLFQPMDNDVFDLKNGVKMMHVKMLVAVAVAGVGVAVVAVDDAVADAGAVMMKMLTMVSIGHAVYAVASIDAQSNPCY